MVETERLFSAASLLASAGWITLSIALFLPRWRRQMIVTTRFAVPLVLAVLYAALIAGVYGSAGGGYGSLAEVRALFDTPELLLAGWVHYLAFDLMVGTLLAEEALARGAPPVLILPVLALTFLFGPLGLLAAAALAGFGRRPRTGIATGASA